MDLFHSSWDVQNDMEVARMVVDEIVRNGRVDLGNGEIYTLDLKVEDDPEAPYADLMNQESGMVGEPLRVSIKPLLRKLRDGEEAPKW